MKTFACSTWGQRIAARRLVFVGTAILTAILAGCHNQPEQAAPVQPHEFSESELFEIMHPTPRQHAIRHLAALIQLYHKSDSLAADDPRGGSYYSFGHSPIKAYANRAAIRVDINRRLDSLRRTGPVNLGNPRNLTDTIPRKFLADAVNSSTVGTLK